MTQPQRLRHPSSDASSEVRDLLRSARRPQPMSGQQQKIADAMIAGLRATPVTPGLTLGTKLLLGTAMIGIAGALFVVRAPRHASAHTASNALISAEISTGSLARGSAGRAPADARRAPASTEVAHVAATMVDEHSAHGIAPLIEPTAALVPAERPAANPTSVTSPAANPAARARALALPAGSRAGLRANGNTNGPSAIALSSGAESTGPLVVSAGDELTRQSEALARAFALLSTAPSDALAQLEAFDTAFPVSQLRSERDFIAFDAMRRLGRADEARSRGEAILSRYPRSMYAPRVRRWLDQTP